MGACAPVVCCARARRGFAHGVLPHALVVCDDHRGLYSEYAAHPRCLLSNASMAATDRRREDACRHGDQCRRSHFADYKLRRLPLCGCASVRASARRSSRYRGTNSSCHSSHCLSNAGREVLHRQTIDLCRLDFNWRTDRCLYLSAARGVALACH